MAARKLKFKPKPSINVSNLRRAKDIDDAGNLSKESILGSVTEEVLKNQHELSELSESGKLNVKSELCIASDSSDNPTLVDVNPTIIKSKILKDSLAVDSVSLDSNSISSHQISYTSENFVTEKSVTSDILNINLESSVNAANVVDKDVCINSTLPLIVDSSETTETVSNKPGPSVGKGLSRLGRSRYKPILSNPDLRKKSDAGTSSEVSLESKVETVEEEPKDNVDVTANSTNRDHTEQNLENSNICTSSSVHQLNNQRTESVIKSVQSELSKGQSIATEITESFSLLESSEEDLPHISSLNSERNKSGSLFLNNDLEAEYTLSRSDVDGSVNIAETVRLGLKQLNASNNVPLSPVRTTSKVLVPKPSPRISEISPRRISFQGSDSEEEVKKKKTYRKKENSKISNEAKETNSQTNKRKRSQGSTYSKMSQETLDKFSKKFGKDEEPDKTKLTMIDLIFYNPKNNPMPQSSQNKPKKKDKTMEINDIIREKIEEEKVDDVEPTAIPVPQLKIGPDGQIILDPQSLVIETTGTEKGREKLEQSEVIQDSGITRYSTYRKKRQMRSEWSRQETLQFFRALNTVGTDFTLMTKLFPTRSRHELKLKFKREEKANLRLVDRAMIEKVDFDFNTLQEDFQRENDNILRKKMEKKLAAEAAQRERAIKKEEMQKNKEMKNRTALNRPKIPKSKALRDFNETDQGKNYRLIKSEANRLKKKRKKPCKKESVDSGEEEQLQIDFDSSSEDDDISILNVVRQTRFGRLPKRTSKLEEYEEINETLKQKLQRESDAEDGYVPNGPDAQMLFGTPLPGDPTAEPEEHSELMDFQITHVPTIEETVLEDENFTDVSEISDLGSFGQNESALDLTLPIRSSVETRLYSQRPDINPLLNSQMIAQSFQIVDQLTSNMQNDVDFCENKGNVSLSDTVNREEVRSRMKIPLPSFESVSHARPSMMYPVETDHIPMEYDLQSEVILPENASDTHRILINYYNSTEEDYAQEVIIGD